MRPPTTAQVLPPWDEIVEFLSQHASGRRVIASLLGSADACTGVIASGGIIEARR